MNYRMTCPVCKRDVAVHGRSLRIWLHRRNGYQCPGSNRAVLLSQIRNAKETTK